jgi:nanoRNase/pAp phosphatase (c-di-AMP/oligoRNAs hydrolase)
MIIDHHQHAVKHDLRGVYADIRAGAGATTTIAYEYLKEAGIAVPRWLAAIMAYAISSETLDLSRDSQQADLDAYLELTTRADLKIIGKIRHAPLPRAYFGHLQEAITGARKLGNLAWSHLREIEQPEIVAEIADLLLRMEGIRWSFCTANLNGHLFVSLRSSQRGARCSHLLRSVIGSSGSAGGHHRMAAGHLDMSKFTPVERENRRREFIHDLTAKIVRRQVKDLSAMASLTQKLVEK